MNYEFMGIRAMDQFHFFPVPPNASGVPLCQKTTRKYFLYDELSLKHEEKNERLLMVFGN